MRSRWRGSSSAAIRRRRRPTSPRRTSASTGASPPSDAFEPCALAAPLRALAAQLGLKPGPLFGILRLAPTGQKVSPPLFESAAILGKDTVLRRIDRAAAALAAAAAG